MKNTYLFIIWDKASWKRERIINDIQNSFEILKDVYIKWDKKNFPRNLLAFYGRKLGDPKGKMISSGTDKFELIIVKDNKPQNEVRKTYSGENIVNINVFNKKQLYRSWTCGSHRIHSSDAEQETIHDLNVLFGPNYEKIVKAFKNNEIYYIDTIGVKGFASIKDFEKSLSLFGENILEKIDKDYAIFCKCRYDVVKFLNCKHIKNNLYQINIDNKPINLYIFGELDGDLLDKTYEDLTNKKTINTIIKDFDNYVKLDRKYIDVERKETFYNRYVVIRNEIKLFIKKLAI